MRKQFRILVVGVAATLALGTVPACAGGSGTESNSPAPSVARSLPTSAHYIADVPIADGKTMTIGVAVEGDEVAAYACDGSSDEAWFFGTQKDGSLDITSKYQDTLKASFNGTDIAGELTMNDIQMAFRATPAPAPAGMYTAEADGIRASWVVRADHSITGVQFKKSNDSDVADLVLANEQKFRDEVRQRRLARQLQQAPPLQFGTWKSVINGVPVVAIIVNGDTRLK
jgi:hypothetical protein